MAFDSGALESALADRGVDALVVDAEGADPDQFYLTDFDAPDPFVAVFDGDLHLLFDRGLEVPRARRQSRAATVHTAAALADGDRGAAVAALCAERDVEGVLVGPRAPVGTADALREDGVSVVIDETGVLAAQRERKDDAERAAIATAQRATETAIRTGVAQIAGAAVDADGVLRLEGDPLTSERVRAAIHVTLVERGCTPTETIVAAGPDAGDPHERGSGPIRAGEPVVIDVFPRHESHYHADTTRTVVRGDPDDRVRAWHAVVDEARRAAIDAIEPGVTGEAVHDAACAAIEAEGVPTLRTDPETETGFVHATGHGVGLAVHEGPRLGEDGGELAPGHVVTVEPGIYDPSIGGVRIEDLVVVTETGCENLTALPTALEVGRFDYQND